MRWMRRLLVAVAVLLALVVAVPGGILGGILVWLKLSPPAMDNTVKMPGLSGPVDLVWDENAVPHIFAPSLRDAYRALGWVHARDRLWQMESSRRLGQGRLAEIIGQPGIEFDREMRVLGLYRLAEQNYETLDPETRADLDAYAAGVNAYLARPAAPLPLEFQILDVTPEPWKPADTLVWGRLMSLQLSSNYREEAIRAELVKRVPEAVFKEFFPDSPYPGPTTLAGLGGIDWKRFAGALPPVLGPDHASNEWVVDGTLTKSGKPLLANDPHLGLAAPILWYLARIVTPEGSLAGVTVPGVPYHLLGHNDHLAWGFTTTGGDVQDLFVEDVDPKDPGKYRTPDGEAAFTTRDETIKVRFGQDVHLAVRESRHGPVISDTDPDLAAAVGQGKAVALSFVGLDPKDTTTEAARAMNRARDVSAFQAAARLWETPEQNLVYADTEGHIGFVSVGPLPIRKRPTEDFPAPGSSGEADWTGLTDFAQLPQAFDPPTHKLVNANNRVVPPDFPTYVGRHYESPFRAERIDEMLDGRTGLTTDDFASMQLDTKTADARLLLPRLLKAEPASAAGREALVMLSKWNARMDRDRPEPLIYTAWVYRLQAALVQERLGPTGRHGYYDPMLTARLLDDEPGGSAKAVALLSSTLDETVDKLAKAYGSDLSAWRWGNAHRATLTSQLFGAVPILGRLFDIGRPTPGGDETVNRAGIGANDGITFPDRHGPGYRGVFDLSDLDKSRFIIATGESGNPLSPYYRTFVRRWRDGGSVTLSGTADEVASRGMGRQKFVP
jgi:penicillin amidase